MRGSGARYSDDASASPETILPFQLTLKNQTESVHTAVRNYVMSSSNFRIGSQLAAQMDRRSVRAESVGAACDASQYINSTLAQSQSGSGSGSHGDGE